MCITNKHSNHFITYKNMIFGISIVQGHDISLEAHKHDCMSMASDMFEPEVEPLHIAPRFTVE